MIKVWAALSKKDVLAKMNLLIQNLNYGNEAWKAGYVRRGSVVGVDEDKDSGIALNSGIGENYDEDDKLALKSDSRVAKLSDDVLRSRIAIFLLGDPSLVGEGGMQMDTTSLGIRGQFCAVYIFFAKQIRCSDIIARLQQERSTLDLLMFPR